MIDSMTLWANVLNTAPDKREDEALKGLRTLLSGATAQAMACKKPSSRLSVFRQAKDNWSAFITRCETNGVKLSMTREKYVDILASDYPEIYALCVERRILIGHKPTDAQQAIIKRAQNTLKSDKQFRLAKLINDTL